jgi:DTW domain-containing protein YfiP
MLKLQRAVLHPKEPSIYGRLRREPRREALSTLESAAEVLVANGEPEAVRTEMRRVFRTMVQRAREFYKERPVPTPEESAEE